MSNSMNLSERKTLRSQRLPELAVFGMINKGRFAVVSMKMVRDEYIGDLTLEIEARQLLTNDMDYCKYLYELIKKTPVFPTSIIEAIRTRKHFKLRYKLFDVEQLLENVEDALKRISKQRDLKENSLTYVIFMETGNDIVDQRIYTIKIPYVCLKRLRSFLKSFCNNFVMYLMISDILDNYLPPISVYDDVSGKDKTNVKDNELIEEDEELVFDTASSIHETEQEKEEREWREYLVKNGLEYPSKNEELRQKTYWKAFKSAAEEEQKVKRVENDQISSNSNDVVTSDKQVQETSIQSNVQSNEDITELANNVASIIDNYEQRINNDIATINTAINHPYNNLETSNEVQSNNTNSINGTVDSNNIATSGSIVESTKDIIKEDKKVEETTTDIKDSVPDVVDINNSVNDIHNETKRYDELIEQDRRNTIIEEEISNFILSQCVTATTIRYLASNFSRYLQYFSEDMIKVKRRTEVINDETVDKLHISLPSVIPNNSFLTESQVLTSLLRSLSSVNDNKVYLHYCSILLDFIDKKWMDLRGPHISLIVNMIFIYACAFYYLELERSQLLSSNLPLFLNNAKIQNKIIKALIGSTKFKHKIDIDFYRLDKLPEVITEDIRTRRIIEDIMEKFDYVRLVSEDEYLRTIMSNIKDRDNDQKESNEEDETNGVISFKLPKKLPPTYPRKIIDVNAILKDDYRKRSHLSKDYFSVMMPAFFNISKNKQFSASSTDTDETLKLKNLLDYSTEYYLTAPGDKIISLAYRFIVQSIEDELIYLMLLDSNKMSSVLNSVNNNNTPNQQMSRRFKFVKDYHDKIPKSVIKLRDFIVDKVLRKDNFNIVTISKSDKHQKMTDLLDSISKNGKPELSIVCDTLELFCIVRNIFDKEYSRKISSFRKITFNDDFILYVTFQIVIPYLYHQFNVSSFTDVFIPSHIVTTGSDIIAKTDPKHATLKSVIESRIPRKNDFIKQRIKSGHSYSYEFLVKNFIVNTDTS